MAYLCSLLFFRCQYLKLCRRGILALPNEIQKLSCTLPNLKCTPCLASLVKYSSTKPTKEFITPPLTQNIHFSYKIEDLKLPQLLKAHKLSEVLIINTVRNLVKAYYAYKGQRGIEEKVKFYLESPSFIKFFEVIDKELYKFSLFSLLTLYDLHVFKTPRIEALLQRVFKLLGENLFTYSFIEKLQVYTSTVRYFPSNSDSKHILEICEDYFKKGLEDDLEYEKLSLKLLNILEAEELPLFVCKMIAEKLADDVSRMSCERSSIGYFVVVIGSNPQLLTKKTLLKLLQTIIIFLPQAVTLKTICQTYSNLVLSDDSLYSQDIVDLMIETVVCANKNTLSTEAMFILKMGYLDKNFVQHVSERILDKARVNATLWDMLDLARIFTQVSADNTMPDGIFEECKQCLQDYDFNDSLTYSMMKSKSKKLTYMDSYCLWVTCLTYIGCDTKTLLNDFFTCAKNRLLYFKSMRELLPLHHMAKAYFPNDVETLGPVILNRLVSLELTQHAQSPDMEECLEKGCLLRNCVNSDYHFFHCLALFGPDNKPINLSEYKTRQLALPSNKYLNISTINKPPGSKLIAFQENIYPYPNEFRNVPKKYGFYQIYKKGFENSGCEIVVLPHYFRHLKLEDKKKFLNKQINEVLGVSENS